MQISMATLATIIIIALSVSLILQALLYERIIYRLKVVITFLQTKKGKENDKS